MFSSSEYKFTSMYPPVKAKMESSDALIRSIHDTISSHLPTV